MQSLRSIPAVVNGQPLLLPKQLLHICQGHCFSQSCSRSQEKSACVHCRVSSQCEIRACFLSAVLWTASSRQICIHGKLQPQNEFHLIANMLPLLKIASCCKKVAARFGASPFSDTAFISLRCSTDTQSTEARSHDVSPSVPDTKFSH